MAKSGAQRTREWRARKKLQQLVTPRSQCKNYQSPLSNNEWAKHYCGHTWKLDYLDRLTLIVWTYLRILIFLPRGHGKTLRIIALAARHTLEKREPLLIITSGPASKQRIFDSIRLILRSEKVKADYGYFCDSIDRNKCTIQLNESLRGTFIDPVLRVCSRGADIIGSHPKWIHLEDIIQEEFKSDESNEGLQIWFKQVVSFCATHEETHETRITGTGTRKAKNDFYQFLIDELKYPDFTEKALELLDGIFPTNEDITYYEDGRIDIDITKGTYKTLGCPNWPLSRLLVEKILKPLEFRTQMQNEPIDPFGNFFNHTMYNETEFTFHALDTSIIITIDPAFGKSTSADNTAICVLGRNTQAPRTFVLLEMFAGKIKSLRKTLLSIYEKYSEWKIIKVSCEANFLQKIMVVDKLNETLPFTVAPFMNKGEKVLRIQSLHDPMVSKQIMIWDKCQGKEAFREELFSWIPKASSASRKDDMLDALQMGYEEFVRLTGSFMPSSGRTSRDFKDDYSRY